MREFDQVSNLFKELEKLFEGEGEYLSHQTALFFLGQIQDVPKTLTAVSPRRRRIREIGEHTLVFVFHPKQKVKQTQSVSIGETSLPVSNLEKTLLDLLTDIQYSPPIETLANFFSSFPYNPIALLDLAKTTSDTVLKRASFFLAWSGRVSYQNLFISHLTRTPIQLDPRMKNFDSIWDNRFHTRYPSKILSVSVISGPQNLGFETASWKELRAHPQILKTMGENSFLFIRDEPSSLQKKLLEGVFKLLLENTGDAEIETFLLGYPKNGFEEGKSPKHYPFLFYQWLDCQQSFPNSHFDLISSWVRSNVYSNDLGKLETALFWGNKLRLYQLIIESLSKNGNRIFSSGKIRVLSSISVALTKSHHPLPFTIYVLAARCLANENRPKDGLKILAGAKKFFEEQDHSEIECGEISYATGNILRGINRLDASVAELYLAREYFEQAGDQRRIAMVDSGLGNLFFACGRNREARAKYLSALSVMRSVGERSAQATLLGSLGLVEYECGRLRRAEQLFGRSQRLHEVLGNSWNQSRIAMSQAKSFLTMGFFAKAKKLFQECYKIKTEQNHLGGMYESASFMAWISVVLGSSAAAKAWWDTIPDGEVKDDFEEPRVLLVFRYLKAMTELFLGNFFLAQSWYQKLYSAVNAQDSTNVAKGNVLHGMGVCQAFQGNSSAPQVLRKAIDSLSGNPDRVSLIQVKLFSSIYFPSHFPEISPETLSHQYISTQAFDPFWGFYSAKILSSQNPKLLEFIHYHLRKSPPPLLKAFSTRVEGFPKLIKKIENRQSRSHDFLSHVTPRGCKPIRFEDYLERVNNKAPGFLIFDGPSGLISFNQNQARIAPDTLPHKVLTHLFVSYPLSIDLDELYTAAWGTSFDSECDSGPLKSVLQRLRKVLSSVNPGIRVCRKRTNSKYGGVCLSMSCCWEAIV